jgi:hypothetical protein
MRNLFEVDSNEMKRILSLHEESTKKQYLNVLSEQTVTNQVFVLKNQTTPGTNDMTIPKGTSFKKSTIVDLLITDTMSLGNWRNGKAKVDKLLYNCITGKFYNQASPKELYNNETLEPSLKAYCVKIKQVPAAAATPAAKTPTNTKKPISTVNVVNTNKAIQTSLGNATPTGQITDTDLDQLIAQLNK